MVCCSKTAIISSHILNWSVYGMEIQNFTFEVVSESLHTVRFNFILYRLKIFSIKSIIGTQAENIVSNLIVNKFL